jgi:hypothetical protein
VSRALGRRGDDGITGLMKTTPLWAQGRRRSTASRAREWWGGGGAQRRRLKEDGIVVGSRMAS